MKERWPIITFTALLALGVGWLVIGDVLDRLSADVDLRAVAESKAIYGPWEFWLHRYQALLAGSFAITAAATAWVAARWQLAAQVDANRQSAFAFWTGVYRSDRQALMNCDTAINVCSIIADEQTKHLGHPQPYAETLWKLRDLTLIPFDPVPTFGIEFHAYDLNSALQGLNEAVRTKYADDFKIGLQFNKIKFIREALISYRRGIDASLRRADARRKELDPFFRED